MRIYAFTKNLFHLLLQIRIVVFTKGTCAMRENILVEECAKNSKKALTVKKPM